MAKLTNRFQRTRLITSLTDKHYTWLWLWTLDFEDDFCSGCWNISHQQQFFSELQSSPGPSYKSYKTLILLGSNHLLCCNQTVTKIETKQTNKAWYGSSLVTFYNEKWGFVDTLFISQQVTGCWWEVTLAVRMCFSGHCHCGEMAIVERLK